jgi:flagellar biosynthesis anti-sigma factor FlgM
MKMTKINARPQGMEAGTDSALNGRRREPQRFEAATSGDVRWERVARLKAAIETGTYRVSSEALAERLIEHMLRAGSQRRADGGL